MHLSTSVGHAHVKPDKISSTDTINAASLTSTIGDEETIFTQHEIEAIDVVEYTLKKQKQKQNFNY